ncbi:MAG: response regulator [Oscillatoria sp. PMC 1051.18]|uniref:response regulator n=1 Tax=Oscillatoria salina TaxID=331517 RepID=UPI0013BBC91E|nr:response regulator [Oscillatoria salina]MBZ8180612.1 response regulator [Oscillatoria salina IIICB1]MEC4894191.1 response regulator [Oscillatoria sp. PMC 1050.18]MEC5030943.1 response regulator [Oscillatoria sp. PMC 1051.18]NET88445.1 response regulator [Kamptonema sp. SIO1D9]
MNATKRILVIDDEDGVREIIQMSIEVAAGWEAIGVASGSEGLAIAATEQPDAILLDVMMPDMDGIATFQRLQANSATRHIPTILLTAKAKISEKQQLLNLGVAGVITKPFEAMSLVAQIQSLLHW